MLVGKLDEAASIVRFCDRLETRLETQKDTMKDLEATLKGENNLMNRISELEDECADKAKTIATLEEKLASGAPVEMPESAKNEMDQAMSAAFGRLAGKAKKKVQKKIVKAVDTAAESAPAAEDGSSETDLAAMREAADLAAMPGWSLDAWLASLALDTLVTNSILGVMRRSDAEINSQVRHASLGLIANYVLVCLRIVRVDIADTSRPIPLQVELGFMQQLGKVGSRDTVLALLRETTLTEDLADAIWTGIQTLTKDLEEEMQRQKEAEEAEEAAAKLEEEMMAELEGMSAEELEDERLAELRESVAETERQEAEAEKKRQEAQAARQKEEEEARAKAAQEQAKLQRSLDDTEKKVSATRDELDEAVERQQTEPDAASAEAIAALEKKLQAVEAEAQKAREEIAQRAEEEKKRAEAAAAKNAEMKRQEEEERARAKAARPKRWALAKMDMKDRQAAKTRKPRKLRKVDAREYNESLKVNSGAFTLAYAPASMYYQGLTAIVGRCDAEAGEDEKLLSLMMKEHCYSIDSEDMFEPPNFLIPTTSKIEYWAVYNPEDGLKELGIEEWPKEQRLGPGHARVLKGPDHFKPGWDLMNARLAEMQEPPLQRHGFVALRLYTGPMFYKYNNVLRGVSVGGVKGPLEWLWMKLCNGNRYTNTLHAITASINKCSRVTKCSLVYRAPGGILPKSFWDADASGVKGGVELGLMSTSTSKHAAMEYAKRSPVKLLFEIQQGMCARGADVSWLSMYPSEDEVLFAPCCACEVHNTRVEGSVVIVELRPAVAAPALQEKSIEQKEEEEKIAAEKRAMEAEARRKAIQEATRSRARWMKSMNNLLVTAAEAKRTAAEHEMAVAVRKAAEASEMEAKAAIEQQKLEESLRSIAKLKELQEEEAAAALEKAEAAKEAKHRLAVFHKLAGIIKRAAAKVRMEQDVQRMMQRKLEEASASTAANLGIGESILRNELIVVEDILAEESSGKVKAIEEQKAMEIKMKDMHRRTLKAEDEKVKLSEQLAANKKMLEKLME